jgi:ribA/ribD-fused uncharacterized protein
MNGPIPFDRASLERAVGQGRTFVYRPFYGHTPRGDGKISDAVFSQFYPCSFQIDGQTYSWAEQWMMASKARLFGDADSLAKILAADTPMACKTLGRGVQDYDDAVWSARRFDLVTEGNVAKFGQDAALCGYLLATGDEVLVEAAPRDTVWGIGYGRDNPAVQTPALWRGQNLLGFAMMRARAQLRGD